MTSMSAAFVMMNKDLDRDLELEILEENVPKKIETREKLNDSGSIKKKKENKRKYDYTANVFKMEEKDAETVKSFKETVNFVYYLAMTMMGVFPNYYWKPQKHLFVYVTIGTLSFAWICFLYTQYLHIANGELMRTLEVFAIYGVALSCIIKISTYIYHAKKIVSLLEFMLDVCRQNTVGRRAEILTNHFRKCLLSLKAFTFGLAANICLFVSQPFFSYFVENRYMALLPSEIIFVDQSSMSGFLTANAIMAICGIYAASGTIFFVALFILIVSNIIVQVELIGDDFKCLDEMWANERIPIAHKHDFLRTICVRCQDMETYVLMGTQGSFKKSVFLSLLYKILLIDCHCFSYFNNVKEAFDTKMFIFFCAAYFSQIICLFEVAKNNWTPGYAIAFLLFEEIMFYCYIGTQKSIANDKLCAVICDTNWYDYDNTSQKMLISLLHSTQNATELQIGPLTFMNLNTGVEIVKSIYSYYTILQELL